MKHLTIQKARSATTWILGCALALDLALSVAGFVEARIRDRNWDKAIAEETDKAKASDGVPETS